MASGTSARANGIQPHSSGTASSSSSRSAVLRGLTSLRNEPWYWSGATKEEINEALRDKADGTFVVRDASNPGDFTLTVRARGQTRLVKVLVQEGRCGFNVENLEAESVQELIDKYRRNSLKSFNANLDTMLLFPLRSRRASEDADHIRFINLERFRTAKCALMRSSKIYDMRHAEHVRAEQLLKSQRQQLVDIRKKAKMMESVSAVQANIFEDLPESGEKHEKKVTAALRANAGVMEGWVQRLHDDEKSLAVHISRLEDFLVKHRATLEEQCERVQAASNQMDYLMTELRGGGDPDKAIIREQEIQSMSDHVDKAREKHESIAISRMLDPITLPWDVGRFLVNEESKTAAGKLIEDARLRILADFRAAGGRSDVLPSFDGIFLIRPSSTQKGNLALSVLYGNKISHCLIAETTAGWGFHKGGLSFVSIGDFVRYYTKSSLVDHNPGINTTLTNPVFP